MTDLTQLQSVLLGVLSSGDEMTRRDIAEKIGRPRDRLNTYDIDTMTALIDAGLVKITDTSGGVARKVYKYKITTAGRRAVTVETD